MSLVAMSSSLSSLPSFHMGMEYNYWPAPEPMEQHKTHDMSLAVISSSLSSLPSFHMEMKYNYRPPAPEPMEQHKTHDDDPPTDAAMENNAEEEDRPGQVDIWNAIQSQKAADGPHPASGAPVAAAGDPSTPYVHPLLRRSPSLLSQKSLEVCTESLGSETGSDDFSSCDSLDYFSSKVEAERKELKREPMLHDLFDDAPKYSEVVAEEWRGNKGKELTSVNYHCSISRKSPPRSFPPPLPSISRRDGPCLHMRPHRRDGRLVVEAVAVPSQNYLHAQREGGRLLLSFIDATVHEPKSYRFSDIVEAPLKQEQVNKIASEEDHEEPNGVQIVRLEAEDEDKVEEQNGYGEEEEEEEEEEELLDEEEEEEEVEVVDRGTVVEVKVSTQLQQQSSATKVVRSSLVINKFVGGTPSAGECEQALDKNGTRSNNSCGLTAAPPTRRAVPTTTTTPAAAAAVAASTVSTISTDGYNEYYVHGSAARPPLDEHNKLQFTSKRRNREELMHNMRRCSQLRRALFICEPCCIATST